MDPRKKETPQGNAEETPFTTAKYVKHHINDGSDSESDGDEDWDKLVREKLAAEQARAAARDRAAARVRAAQALAGATSAGGAAQASTAPSTEKTKQTSPKITRTTTAKLMLSGLHDIGSDDEDSLLAEKFAAHYANKEVASGCSSNSNDDWQNTIDTEFFVTTSPLMGSSPASGSAAAATAAASANAQASTRSTAEGTSSNPSSCLSTI